MGKGIHHHVHGPWNHESLEAAKDYFAHDDATFRSETGMPGAQSLAMIRKYAGDQNSGRRPRRTRFGSIPRSGGCNMRMFKSHLRGKSARGRAEEIRRAQPVTPGRSPRLARRHHAKPAFPPAPASSSGWATTRFRAPRIRRSSISMATPSPPIMRWPKCSKERSHASDNHRNSPPPQARQNRTNRLRHRPGLHGHERILRRRAMMPNRRGSFIAPSSSASIFSTRPTSTATARNETLVGNAIRDRRDKVFLATKFANIRDEKGAVQRRQRKTRLREEGLRRIAQTARAFAHRFVLPASRRPRDADRGHRRRDGGTGQSGQSKIPRPVAKPRRRQSGGPRKSIRSPRCKRNIRCGRAIRKPKSCPTCRELGITFVAYSPLGRGFLTGQIKSPSDLAPDDWRHNNPRFQGENFSKNLDLVRQIEAMAAKKKIKPSQLALAWVLAQGNDIVPIPGTKRMKYLEENAAAVKIELSRDDIAATRTPFSPPAQPPGRAIPKPE